MKVFINPLLFIPRGVKAQYLYRIQAGDEFR
jgi:hypothetical protein